MEYNPAQQDIVEQLVVGAGWRVIGYHEEAGLRAVLVASQSQVSAKCIVTAPVSQGQDVWFGWVWWIHSKISTLSLVSVVWRSPTVDGSWAISLFGLDNFGRSWLVFIGWCIVTSVYGIRLCMCSWMLKAPLRLTPTLSANRASAGTSPPPRSSSFLTVTTSAR